MCIMILLFIHVPVPFTDMQEDVKEKESTKTQRYCVHFGCMLLHCSTNFVRILDILCHIPYYCL